MAISDWIPARASDILHRDKLIERVKFIHERIGTAAIAEQYIEGREIYVGIVGNERLLVLPVWELQFKNMPQGDWLIATEKVKHDTDYQSLAQCPCFTSLSSCRFNAAPLALKHSLFKMNG